jgi:hypothetical protein
MLRDFAVAAPIESGRVAPQVEADAARAAGLRLERTFVVTLPDREYQVTYFETEGDFASALRALGLPVPAIELVGEWEDPAITKHRQGLGFVFPLRPDAAPALREFGDEAFHHRRFEHHVSRRALGLTREVIFMCASLQGDLVVFYVEGDHPRGAYERFSASPGVHDAWFRAQCRQLFAGGYDLDAPLPPIRTVRDRDLSPVPA